MHDVYRHGFCFYLTATNDTATNITAYNSYGTSPVCIYGAGTTGNLLQKSTIYQDTDYASDVCDAGAVGHHRGARRIEWRTPWTVARFTARRRARAGLLFWWAIRGRRWSLRTI